MFLRAASIARGLAVEKGRLFAWRGVGAIPFPRVEVCLRARDKNRARVIIDVRLGERSPTVDAALCLLFRESGGKPPHSILCLSDVVWLLSRVLRFLTLVFWFFVIVRVCVREHSRGGPGGFGEREREQAVEWRYI